MPLTAHLKSTGLLLICFVIPLATSSQPTASAQSTCVTCASPQTYVPMYLQFGVDPYRQRQIGYMPFTPLQTNLYQAPTISRCLPCESLAIDSNPVVVQGNVIESPVAPVPVVDSGTPEIARANDQPESKTNPDSENTVSSPSDIVLSAKNTDEPTLADGASSKTTAQLKAARDQIASLKEGIAEGKEQARVAMERAYAAEKAANAAKTNAEKSRMQLLNEKKRLVQVAEDATAQAKKHEDEIGKLLAQLREMESQDASQTTAKASSGKSEAEKRVAKLYADAKKAAQAKKKTEGQPKQKAPNPPTNRISDQPKKKPADNSKKKNPSDAPVQQQIKDLQATMERQIKNTSAKIRKQNQAAIKKLIDSGKKDSDPAVKTLKEKLATELKENEAKIRKRVEQRINRIRKQADGN